MQKFLLSLVLIAIGMLIGQILRGLVNKEIIKDKILVEKYIKIIQNIILLIVFPYLNISTFWMAKITDSKLIVMPFMGVASIVLGGVLALFASKLLKLDRKEAGAMFVSGSFTNMGTFGGLICFMFFGEISYAFVAMYRLFEEFTYYTVGFPIAKLYGDNYNEASKNTKSIIKIIRDPFILVYFFSIIIGIGLNILGIERPHVFSNLNIVIIPLSSVILVTSVGYRMRFSAVGKYIKECLAISSIKFIIMPLTMTLAAYLLGLTNIYDGMVFKIILILSSMPPAFNSLIPPQLYGLDIDLANSSWLFNTGALIFVLPILYFIQNLI